MFSERQVMVGGVPVGGDAPVVVQSMTNTRTDDVAGTLAQIRALATAGAALVRVAVPDGESAAALRSLVAESPVPLIGDVHFDHRLAVAALEAGVGWGAHQPGQHRGSGGRSRRGGRGFGARRGDPRGCEQRFAAARPARSGGPRSGGRSGGVGRALLRATRGDGFLRHQGLCEVVGAPRDHGGQPHAGRARPLSSPHRGHRGGDAVGGLYPQRGRPGGPAGRRGGGHRSECLWWATPWRRCAWLWRSCAPWSWHRAGRGCSPVPRAAAPASTWSLWRPRWNGAWRSWASTWK